MSERGNWWGRVIVAATFGVVIGLGTPGLFCPASLAQGGGAQGHDAGLSDDPPATCTLRGKSSGAGRHAFEVRLGKRPFQRTEHLIAGVPGRYQVDGKTAIGTDGGLPREELSRFEVRVDGRRWQVPSRLWRDCYEAHLQPATGRRTGGKPPGPGYEPWKDEDSAGPGSVRAWLTEDGRQLSIRLYGSDGAGSYAVVWNLRADGDHTRKLFGPP